MLPSDRLELNLEIKHPVTPNETITKGPDDAPAKMLRDKIKEGLETLKILDDPSCTRTQALAAWDKFYATDYFTKRDATKARVTEAAAALTTPAILTSRTEAAPPPVRKDGGGRYA